MFVVELSLKNYISKYIVVCWDVHFNMYVGKYVHNFIHVGTGDVWNDTQQTTTMGSFRVTITVR